MFWPCHDKNSKHKHYYTTLAIILYATNPQNTIIKNALKHYNKFRSVRNEDLRWLKITTDTGTKLKVETKVKERDQQLLEFIKIYVLKIEQQHPSGQEIITLPMTPIINSSFNKHPMPWELIHHHLLHPYDSVMKAMHRHQTLPGLPKHCPKKLKQSPCTICYTENMTTYPKGTTVGTNNLQPGELIHMDFYFYSVNSIRGFNSMLTVVCTNTIII